jgi:hypothetical protein
MASGLDFSPVTPTVAGWDLRLSFFFLHMLVRCKRLDIPSAFQSRSRATREVPAEVLAVAFLVTSGAWLGRYRM